MRTATHTGLPALMAALAWLVSCPVTAQPIEPPAPPTPPAGAAGDTSFLVENMTRVEAWRYFQPPPNGGREPDYVLAGNRSTLGAAYRGRQVSFAGTLQYVRVENLPAGAIGPGLLGAGGAYYFQAAGTFSYQFYLRALSLAVHDRERRRWVEAGRFSRAAETEPATGDPAIDAVVRRELNGRLLGDMEWSFYQRAWDGVRGGVAAAKVAVTATLALPTQGTFEESANLFMDRVRVGALEASSAPGLVPHARLDAFAYTYDDTRPVEGRPDNTGLTAARADVHVRTFGAAWTAAYPAAWGAATMSAWVAGQTGRWYGQAHAAGALAGHVGVRFDGVGWRPWVRAGATHASGDADGSDDRHGTFFPMLPSGDRASSVLAFALMNVTDVWGGVEVAPSPRLELRAAVHTVDLARGTDRWYQGSGATIRTGNYFGFQGRATNAATSLGTIVDGTLAWRPARWWTLRLSLGRMAGGDAVAARFVGRRLTTGWLESTVRF